MLHSPCVFKPSKLIKKISTAAGKVRKRKEGVTIEGSVERLRQ